MAVMGLWADGRALAASLVAFSWPVYAGVIALTLVNYVLRFGKWHYFLSCLGHRPPLKDSAIVFTAGMSMSVTPGKVGELLKAVLLEERTGIPATDTATVVIGERATDFLALVLLSASGAFGSGYGVLVLSIALGGTLAFIVVASSDRLSRGAVQIVARLPLGAKIAPKLEQMRGAMAALVRPGPLLVTTLLGVCSWGCECIGYNLVLYGLPDTVPNLGHATFVYAFATVFGAVTMLPGGLGATEGSLVGLSHRVFGLASTPSAATAAALLIRFATLWLGVVIGLVAIVLGRAGGRLRSAGASRKP